MLGGTRLWSVAASLSVAIGAQVALAQPPAAPAEPEGAPEEGEVPPPPADQATPSEGLTPPPGGEPPEEQRLKLVVIDAATYGIDPVVGRHVTDGIRGTGREIGYEVLDREGSVAAAQRIRMPYPPSPADLWRVTYAAGTQRGAFARVWAHAGQYVIEVIVASLDGAGPFFARGTSGAQNLHEVVAQLTRQALPPPSTWQPEAAAQHTRPSTPPPAQPEAGETPPPARPAPPPAPPPVPIGKRWNLVLQTEGAIGTSEDSFYNHLFGGRIDYRISRDILLGAYVGYANLRGKDGRVSNVLTALQIENRVRVSSSSDISIPLRLAIGYLPFNGPVVRLAGGVNIPLSRDLELGFDILVPTFWVLPDRTAVSLDLAAELIFRL